MKKRLSHEDFHKLLEAVWEAGPEVRYKNPDAWIAHMIKRALKKKKKSDFSLSGSCSETKKTGYLCILSLAFLKGLNRLKGSESPLLTVTICL